MGRDMSRCPAFFVSKGDHMMKKAALTVLFLLSISTAFADGQRFQVPIADSPQLGPADAPVTIIEFLDFQ